MNITKRVFILFTGMVLISGCDRGAGPGAGTPVGEQHVVLATDVGEVMIDLFEEDAPKHAANFRKLVEEGFFANKTFHRVVEGVLAQGAVEQSADGSAELDHNVPAEINRPHIRGAVAAARKADAVNPNRSSHGAQFYICLDDLPDLDAGGYTVFGHVVRGISVVEKFKKGDPGVNNGVVPAGGRTVIQSARLVPAASVADEYVVLTTDLGEIVIDVFEQSTPGHAANFKKLAREGFYSGSNFHRVIEGFMAQGGGPKSGATEPPRIPAEIELPHRKYSVAAARSPDSVNPQKMSSGSGFYICFAPQPHLDAGGYSVFGHVVRGTDVVDKITRGDPRANGAVPAEKRTRILEAKVVASTEVDVENPSPEE